MDTIAFVNILLLPTHTSGWLYYSLIYLYEFNGDGSVRVSELRTVFLLNQDDFDLYWPRFFTSFPVVMRRSNLKGKRGVVFADDKSKKLR